MSKGKKRKNRCKVYQRIITILIIIIALLFWYILAPSTVVHAETITTSDNISPVEHKYIFRYTEEPSLSALLSLPLEDKFQKLSYFYMEDYDRNKSMSITTEPMDEDWYVCAEDGLRIRSSMNKDSTKNIVTTLPYRTKVRVIGRTAAGWEIVKYENQILFAWSEYLSKDKPKKLDPVDKIRTDMIYSASDLKFRGAINWGGWRWTWYSQNVLPGGGLSIPGRHVDENNYICDENGYICLASGSLAKGTVVDTPFGKQGKIYDCGCAANTLDVYTNF